MVPSAVNVTESLANRRRPHTLCPSPFLSLFSVYY